MIECIVITGLTSGYSGVEELFLLVSVFLKVPNCRVFFDIKLGNLTMLPSTRPK